MSKFNLTKFKNTATRTFTLTKIFIEKHAPLGLIIAGTGTLVYAGIEAYNSRDKVNKTLDKYEVKEQNNEAFTRMDVAVDLVQDLAKPLLLMGTGVAAIATGTAIYNKRLHLLTLGMAALTEEHERFVNQTREHLGEEEFAKLFTEATEVVDEETGEVNKITTAANNSDLFARWFQYSENHTDDPGFNEHFFRDVEQWAQTEIMRKGWLSYPALMEKLGFDVNPYQLNFGWFDTTGFYLEWQEHEIFDEESLSNKIEHLVSWKRPVTKY